MGFFWTESHVAFVELVLTRRKQRGEKEAKLFCLSFLQSFSLAPHSSGGGVFFPARVCTAANRYIQIRTDFSLQNNSSPSQQHRNKNCVCVSHRANPRPFTHGFLAPLGHVKYSKVACFSRRIGEMNRCEIFRTEMCRLPE